MLTALSGRDFLKGPHHLLKLPQGVALSALVIVLYHFDVCVSAGPLQETGDTVCGQAVMPGWRLTPAAAHRLLHIELLGRLSCNYWRLLLLVEYSVWFWGTVLQDSPIECNIQLQVGMSLSRLPLPGSKNPESRYLISVF